MASRRGKRILKIVAAVLGGLLILLAVFPLWFPWLLRPIAPAFGAHYSKYERLGYGRFALTTASFTNATVRVHAGRIEGPVPTAWAWQRYVLRQPPVPLAA